MTVYTEQANQVADQIANQFEGAFKERLAERFSVFFGGGCAQTFAEIVTTHMAPALQDVEAAAPARRLTSPTRGLGFGRKLASAEPEQDKEG